MAIELKIDDKEVRQTFKSISQLDRQKILDDAATILLNSAKIGYARKVDPELKPWPENPKWYADMKGQNSPLTGPTTKKVKGGRFKGWEFQTVNTTRMANELWKTVGENKAEIFYKRNAKERATLTQTGGESKMILKSSGRTVEFNIKIQPRIHLGVSDKYSRIPGGSDVEHIERMIDETIKKRLGV